MADIVFHYTPPAHVELIALGANIEHLATVVRGYAGVYSSDIEWEEIEKFTQELQNTKLKTPTAFVGFIFLLKNITRNFEQQLTRYRIGTAFVAESLRFSEKRKAEFYNKQKTDLGRAIFAESCKHSVMEYERMLKAGEAVQDARDVLPSSICTHMFAYLNLQTLTHVYEQRACCQAQAEEWHAVLNQMKLLLLEQQESFADFLKAPWENPLCVDCGFRANFDRPCIHQNKFDRNLTTLYRDRAADLGWSFLG